MKRRLVKFLKVVAVTVVLFLALLLLAHGVGYWWNNRVPAGGINESGYVDINGTKQWINIYGQNKENPVLLYLHGGPGSPTSAIDYVFTRKWSDIYTIVSWDQRNCGKSYDASAHELALTKALLLEDGKQMTEYIREQLKVSKITILGHSWGSLYGANLVQAYPDYYNLFIGTGQMVDPLENEKALKEAALTWAEGDASALDQIEELKPEEMTLEYIKKRNALLDKYGYSMMKDGTDYFLPTSILFNPNYSCKDWMGYFYQDRTCYLDFIRSDEFQAFSLKDKYIYQVPYININGDMDYQANYQLAQAYFEKNPGAPKRNDFDAQYQPRPLRIKIRRILPIAASSI